MFIILGKDDNLPAAGIPQRAIVVAKSIDDLSAEAQRHVLGLISEMRRAMGLDPEDLVTPPGGNVISYRKAVAKNTPDGTDPAEPSGASKR